MMMPPLKSEMHYDKTIVKFDVIDTYHINVYVLDNFVAECSGQTPVPFQLEDFKEQVLECRKKTKFDSSFYAKNFMQCILTDIDYVNFVTHMEYRSKRWTFFFEAVAKDDFVK